MCKHLNKRYTMYVKTFNFFIKINVFKKNSRIEKKRDSFAAASPEKHPSQPLSVRLPPEF